MEAALALGFSDPPRDSQRVFRSLMDALARPGTIQPLATPLRPPAPLTPELAAIALTLADHETAVWLDDALVAAPSVATFLSFHTGAPITADPSAAQFALFAEGAGVPRLDRFSMGTPEYPDRSTTLVFATSGLSNDRGLRLEGPGIADTLSLSAPPLEQGLAAALMDTRGAFPLGLDCLFAAPGCVAGLPRTTRIIGDA